MGVNARTLPEGTIARETDATPADDEILALSAEFQQLQAKISPNRIRFEPLQLAYEAILHNRGASVAKAWVEQVGFWPLNDEIADLCERATHIVERMIVLRPKTQAGIAAVAEALKADQNHFWKEPEPERDWDISLVTRFIDGLIECSPVETKRADEKAPLALAVRSYLEQRREQ
jgi:hypothetical protein